MHRDSEFLAGDSNKRMRMIVYLLVLVLAAGCATPRAPKQTVFAPVYSDSECRAAVKEGVQAMADFSREKAIANLENRQPNYAKASEGLADALTRLQPGKVSPAKPEYDLIAVYFQTALEGIDRIVAGQKEGDEAEQAVGWEIFDRSAGELLLVLEPYASVDVKGPVRRP